MSIDAMKMALGALDNWCDLERSYNERNLILDSREAITALRAAIKAAERQEPYRAAHWECYSCGYEGETKEHKRLDSKWPGTYVDCQCAEFVPDLYTTPQPAIPAWQPIETAPDDGTEFLATFDGQIVIAWYGVDPNNILEVGEWLHGTGDDFSIGSYYNVCNPTHWMPLPAAPKEPT